MANEKQEQISINEKTNQEDTEGEQLKKCDVCGEYHKKSITHGFEIKGQKKYICQGCADTIHGLV